MFQLDNSTPNATNGSYLAGNAIHKVKLAAVTEDKVGKNGSEVVRIRFEAVDGEGAYEDVIFEPTNGTREKSGPNNYESPSQVEQFQTKLRQYIAALNPTLDKAINDGTKKIGAKTWAEMRKVIIAALTSNGKSIGRETELKLLKNKAGYAQAPGFVAGLTKPNTDGISKVYHTTKFIGEGLTFTDRELTAINKAASSTPTNMKSEDDLGGDLDDTNSGGEFDDFDVTDL